MTDNNKKIARRARVCRAAMVLALFGVAAAAHGQSQSKDASEVGHATETWLALQRDNRAAGPDLPMLGYAASLAYQRYIDSFKGKIPQSMGSPVNAAGGMSSGGQGSAQSY